MTSPFQSVWTGLLAACLTLGLSAPAEAASISYGANNRPISFEGVTLDGVVYDIAVTWDSNYVTVYASGDPIFLGDEPGAIAAMQAMSQALVDDGYTTSSTPSYLDVPYENTGTLIRGWSIYLPNGPTYQQYVEAFPDTYYGTVGYTVWTVVSPVNAPLLNDQSLGWLAVALLAVGVAGLRVRRIRSV